MSTELTSSISPHTTSEQTSNLPTATSEHPKDSSIDPTIYLSNQSQEPKHGATGILPTTSSASSTELSRLTLNLRAALRQFPDFPTPGILFEDIMPIFSNASLHASLIRALELHVTNTYGAEKPDVIVGLEARGFLFGPSLALRIGVAFVPVRKKDKLPGPTVEAGYEKEYGTDWFQLQADAIKPGQKVLIVDDIIATGKFSSVERR